MSSWKWPRLGAATEAFGSATEAFAAFILGSKISQLEGAHDIKKQPLEIKPWKKPELGKNIKEIHEWSAVHEWMWRSFQGIEIDRADAGHPLVESESVRLHPFRGYILRVRTLGRPTELTCHLPPPGWQRWGWTQQLWLPDGTAWDLPRFF